MPGPWRTHASLDRRVSLRVPVDELFSKPLMRSTLRTEERSQRKRFFKRAFTKEKYPPKIKDHEGNKTDLVNLNCYRGSHGKQATGI
ncbi:hypothetical protein Y1Q_0005429 [Alligator mississippiensis]|uniref:Uncharacterized protein n=1 Tax=Alligator mississippiensis TaxID=8496 RepID=A0A151MZR4_ALLMI|nr:hypothetical protein Y1Q_0005429 [Alligator mississippiensis]